MNKLLISTTILVLGIVICSCTKSSDGSLLNLSAQWQTDVNGSLIKGVSDPNDKQWQNQSFSASEMAFHSYFSFEWGSALAFRCCPEFSERRGGFAELLNISHRAPRQAKAGGFRGINGAFPRGRGPLPFIPRPSDFA